MAGVSRGGAGGAGGGFLPVPGPPAALTAVPTPSAAPVEPLRGVCLEAWPTECPARYPAEARNQGVAARGPQSGRAQAGKASVSG